MQTIVEQIRCMCIPLAVILLPMSPSGYHCSALEQLCSPVLCSNKVQCQYCVYQSTCMTTTTLACRDMSCSAASLPPAGAHSAHFQCNTLFMYRCTHLHVQILLAYSCTNLTICDK